VTPRPTLLSRLVHRLLVALYRRRGYRFEGGHPGVSKCVVTGAPHTSNWDFVFVLGAVEQLGLKPAFIGKHTLFKWPMTRFMRDMGGIAVDRGKRAKFVDQVAAAFAASDELALVIAPEGSRGSEGQWKSGFYHIALSAGVPIVPAWVDQERRMGGIGEPIWPTGDYRADLLRIAEFYRSKRPDCARFERLAQSLRDDDKQGEGSA
jgi:1-acyl-sn-glycerol-3-phosphate acyltransferase